MNKQAFYAKVKASGIVVPLQGTREYHTLASNIANSSNDLTIHQVRKLLSFVADKQHSTGKRSVRSLQTKLDGIGGGTEHTREHTNMSKRDIYLDNVHAHKDKPLKPRMFKKISEKRVSAQ